MRAENRTRSGEYAYVSVSPRAIADPTLPLFCPYSAPSELTGAEPGSIRGLAKRLDSQTRCLATKQEVKDQSHDKEDDEDNR